MKKVKVREIDKSTLIKPVVDTMRTSTIRKQTQSVLLHFGKFSADKESVTVVSKLRIDPKALLPLAMLLVEAAVTYEKKTGIRVLPEDFPETEANLGNPMTEGTPPIEGAQ